MTKVFTPEPHLKKKHDAVTKEPQRTEGKIMVHDFRLNKKRKFGWHSNQGTLCNLWRSKFKDNGGVG